MTKYNILFIDFAKTHTLTLKFTNLPIIDFFLLVINNTEKFQHAYFAKMYAVPFSSKKFDTIRISKLH